MTPRFPTMTRAAMVVLLLTVGVVVGGCGADGEPETAAVAPRDQITAEVATATVRTVPVDIAVTGSVEPWRRVSPGTKLLGRIERVAVSEGQAVADDETLVLLEKRDLEAALRQAEAGVEVAEAKLANVTAQHDRFQALHERGSATDKDLEDVQAAFRMAEAGLQQARANVESARVMLGYAEVRAPFAGRVVTKHAESGDMARPGAPLVTLEDLSRVKVILQVPEAHLVGMEAGDPVRVEVGELSEALDARIDRILPAANRGSRTFDVQLVLANPDGRLRSGMYVRARFTGGERQALAVPASALVRRGQLDGVFVVGAEGVARLRWIQLGAAIDDGVEVLSGLDPGERFLVAPPAGTTDGVRVTGSRGR